MSTRITLVSRTCILYRAFVTHPRHMFCVTRLSCMCFICSMLHVLCLALVAHMYYVLRACRTHIFCIARSSRICIADSASRSCRTHIFCIARSSRTYISVSRARRASVLHILRRAFVAFLHHVFYFFSHGVSSFGRPSIVVRIHVLVHMHDFCWYSNLCSYAWLL